MGYHYFWKHPFGLLKDEISSCPFSSFFSPKSLENSVGLNKISSASLPETYGFVEVAGLGLNILVVGLPVFLQYRRFSSVSLLIELATPQLRGCGYRTDG